jgi:hypothetical protein
MVVVSTNSPSSLCTSLSQFIILVPFESSPVNIGKCIKVKVFDETEAATFTLFNKDVNRLIDTTIGTREQHINTIQTKNLRNHPNISCP